MSYTGKRPASIPPTRARTEEGKNSFLRLVELNEIPPLITILTIKLYWHKI